MSRKIQVRSAYRRACLPCPSRFAAYRPPRHVRWWRALGASIRAALPGRWAASTPPWCCSTRRTVWCLMQPQLPRGSTDLSRMLVPGRSFEVGARGGGAGHDPVAQATSKISSRSACFRGRPTSCQMPDDCAGARISAALPRDSSLLAFSIGDLQSGREGACARHHARPGAAGRRRRVIEGAARRLRSPRRRRPAGGLQ